MSEELIHKSVEELASLLKTKQISPVEVFAAYSARIEETDAKVNAYISVYEKEGLVEAQKAEKEIFDGNYRGMYHGIPMGIKDNIFFKGRRTTMASKIHKDFVPSYDARVVEKMKDAGVVFLGKLNMHEYAMSITSSSPHFGPVHNPWNLDKIPGGSSGGSGAAVALGSSAASVGTDSAGSIRIPAAACGIVGLKPTRGLISTHGVFPLSWTLDHVGPMTKTVRDAAGLMEVLVDKEHENADAYVELTTGNIENMVIGIDENYFFKDVDAPIENALWETLHRLEKRGAKLKKVAVNTLEGREDAVFTFAVSEASTVHYNSILSRIDDFGADIRGFMEIGAFPSTHDYERVTDARQKVIADFEALYKEVDVLVSPTVPVFPNNIGEVQADLNGQKVDLLPNFIRMTGPGNLTGYPAISVPCGMHEGLPIGIQFISKPYTETFLLNIGYAIEQEGLMQGIHPVL